MEPLPMEAAESSSSSSSSSNSEPTEEVKIEPYRRRSECQIEKLSKYLSIPIGPATLVYYNAEDDYM